MKSLRYHLLDQLALRLDTALITQSEMLGNWQIQPILGGRNNWVFRATSSEHDLALKWTMRDQRDRAGREWAALTALAQHQPGLAPQALLLEQSRYRWPLIVQQWVTGHTPSLPQTDHEWQEFIAYFRQVHQLQPVGCTTNLRQAVITASSPAACRALLDGQLRLLPESLYPSGIQQHFQRLEERMQQLEWIEPELSLCRVDCNLLNFIRTEHGLQSVDWENSGWGDPAWEIADWLTHPAYLQVPQERRRWVAEHYAQGDAWLLKRIKIWYHAMLIFWLIRLERVLYELPRGNDQRLAAPPENWQAETLHNQRWYHEQLQDAW